MPHFSEVLSPKAIHIIIISLKSRFYQLILIPFAPYRFTTMAITGLVPGKQYEFRVYAENIYGRSEPSETTTLVQTKAIIKKEFKKKEYPGKILL